MTYDYYLDLISRAKFTITFGEGFDAYFSEPIMSGSVSFCVYNTIFFPETFKDLDTVYNSFEILIEKIVNDINNYNKNEVSYNKYSNLVKNKIEKLYSPKIFKDALEAYHLGNYDFK